MANESYLLRMLEPAVRPGQAGGVARPPRQTLESRSFDSFLEEARQVDANQSDITDADQPPDKAGPLSSLAALERIDNPSVRKMIRG